MSDKKGLGDFFNAQKKKKAVTTKKPSEKTSQKEMAAKEEIKHAEQEENFAESSDEEKTDIIDDTNAAVIKDKKEIEASKKAQAESEQGEGFGWTIGGKVNSSDFESKMPAHHEAATKANQPAMVPGEIKFQAGKPTFNRKKGMVTQEAFPELGAVDTKKGGAEAVADSGLAKKDQASIGMFGAGAVGQVAPREEKKEMKKPVFTSSKGKSNKLNLGGDASEIQSSKQNYDFSTMRVSAATSKTAAQRKQEAEDGVEGDEKKDHVKSQPKTGSGERVDKPKFAVNNNIYDDDDFEMVTDKKRGKDIQFGGKPSFSRGK